MASAGPARAVPNLGEIGELERVGAGSPLCVASDGNDHRTIRGVEGPDGGRGYRGGNVDHHIGFTREGPKEGRTPATCVVSGTRPLDPDDAGSLCLNIIVQSGPASARIMSRTLTLVSTCWR